MTTNKTKPKILREGKFDAISPTDYRYKVNVLQPYLSEESFISYKSKVEAALARVLAERGIISRQAAEKIGIASEKVKAAEVYMEEDKTHHDIIAQVNRIRSRLRKEEDREARAAVHRTATSYDIIDTANTMRFKDAFLKVIIPDMISLEKLWIGVAKENKSTLQIGRTHLQHAEPITFGFATASFVSRLGGRILFIKRAVDALEAKFSGAAGTHSAASLFVGDPVKFENDILTSLGVRPTEISTQITQQEPIVDLNHGVTSAFGVLANWAVHVYHLQRPEIAELSQPGRGLDISRSSAMPHKANPVGVENIQSIFKLVMPHMITTYLDQISFHQRDLTNSATSRYNTELYDLFDYSVKRAIRVTKTLVPNIGNMKRNFETSSRYIVAEPLQLILASLGHPNAHEAVGELADLARQEGKSLMEIVEGKRSMRKYLRQFTQEQKAILSDPSKYLGVAQQKTLNVADHWEAEMRALEQQLG